MEFLAQIFTPDFVRQIASVLVLVVADLAFGVIVALKNGVFDVRKLAEFYKTTVLTYVLGWMTLVVLVKLVTLFGLIDIAPVFPDSLQTGSFAIIVATMGFGLMDKFKALWGKVPGKEA